MLPWFLVSAVLIVFAVGWIYERFALKGVSYTRYFTQRAVFEEDPLEMVEVISNAKPLPLPWLRLESSMAAGIKFGRQNNLDVYAGDIYQNHISMFYLRPFRQITRRHQVSCVRRGLYRLESATLTTGDPLGIVAKVLKFELNLELLVYPRILALEELPLPNHSWLGNLAVRRWIVEDPFLTSGIREYRSGDTLKSINWKATAKTGVMQVHQRDYTADHRLVICLNVESSETMWRNILNPERIELGIRYAASVAGYALQNGIETGFLCNGRLKGGSKDPIRLEPSADGGQLEWLLDTLARVELDRSVSMTRLLEEELEADTRETDFLIISCHQGETLLIQAELLERNGNGIEWMDIPETA
ncbi:DUF58 domain-containing protein [Paenibacillus sp. Marseille-P2973]|uniref:DUF58 domain-containing protein n=1 Tax=Paenibacillus sp. Marseille-P2973 TaxID=1871032 RepID=UPI001B35CEF7|nr:DUF58 domain-containing protein [Paenibacillus sp. Marseille-P2973]MBQ4899686.1 DUF58 domain-containing protein [Paenibacillus sp. Marseille-P2973]